MKFMLDFGNKMRSRFVFGKTSVDKIGFIFFVILIRNKFSYIWLSCVFDSCLL